MPNRVPVLVPALERNEFSIQLDAEGEVIAYTGVLLSHITKCFYQYLRLSYCDRISVVIVKFSFETIVSDPFTRRVNHYW